MWCLKMYKILFGSGKKIEINLVNITSARVVFKAGASGEFTFYENEMYSRKSVLFFNSVVNLLMIESVKIRDAFPNGISNDESRVVRERLERLISSLLDAPKQPVILNEFEGAYV